MVLLSYNRFKAFLKRCLANFYRRIKTWVTAHKVELKATVRYVIFPVCLIGIMLLCLNLFELWNKVPNHTISMRIIPIGKISYSSSFECNIIINAGSTTLRKSKERPFTTLTFHHSSIVAYTNWNEKLYNRLRDSVPDYLETIKKMETFYFVDYACRSQVNVNISLRSSKRSSNFTDHCFSYITSPHLKKDSIGEIITGWGAIAYDNAQDYHTTGHIEFNTNLLNGYPGVMSFWDVTQANYTLCIKDNNIKCKKINIDFGGATIFSNMYPTPDKITMNSVEFTNPHKIREIENNGLRFHTEFTELKELSSIRTFVLSGIFSIAIAFLVNILYGFIYKKH